MLLQRWHCACFRKYGCGPGPQVSHHGGGVVGADISLGCCGTSHTHICQGDSADAGAAVDLAVRQIASVLTSLVDKLGKKTALLAEALFVFESCGGEAEMVERRWAICTWPVYSPKFQLWTLCEFAARNPTASSVPELQFPYEVDIVSAPSKVSPMKRCVAELTTAELALMLAKITLLWRCALVEYMLPDVPSLLPSRVDKLACDSVPMSGPAVKLSAAQKRKAPPANSFLDSLKRRTKMLRIEDIPSGGSADAAPAIANGVVADEATLAPPLVIADAAVAEPDMGRDEFLGEDEDAMIDVEEDALLVFEELDLADVFDFPDAEDPPVLAEPEGDEVLVEEVDTTMIGDDGAPGDAEPPLPPIPPAVEGLDEADIARVIGPSALGYFNLDGRSVGRLTAAFGGSNRGIKCYVHPGRCTLAVVEAKVPSADNLKRWILRAERYVDGDTKDDKQAKLNRHMDDLRSLRDRTAPWMVL